MPTTLSTRRPRGRPRGYVHPTHVPVRDPEAFARLWAALVHGASERAHGAGRALAQLLGTSAFTVSTYRRRVPRAVTPALAAAIRRAPLVLARYDTPIEQYRTMIDAAIGSDDAPDGSRGAGTAGAPRPTRWLPAQAEPDTLPRLPDVLNARLQRSGGVGVADATVAQLRPRVWYRVASSVLPALRVVMRGRGILLEQPTTDTSRAVLWLPTEHP